MSPEREHADDREVAPAPPGPATDVAPPGPAAAPPGPVHVRDRPATAGDPRRDGLPPAAERRQPRRRRPHRGQRARRPRDRQGLEGGGRREGHDRPRLRVGAGEARGGPAAPLRRAAQGRLGRRRYERLGRLARLEVLRRADVGGRAGQPQAVRDLDAAGARPHLLRGRLGRDARALQERGRGPRARQPRQQPLLRLQRDGAARHPTAAAQRRAAPGAGRPRAARDADRRRARGQGPGGHGQDAQHPRRDEVRGLRHRPGRLHGRGDRLLRPGEAAPDAGRPGQAGLGGGQEGVRQARPLHQAGDGPVACAVRAGGGRRQGRGRVRRACHPRRRARSSSRSCRR